MRHARAHTRTHARTPTNGGKKRLLVGTVYSDPAMRAEKYYIYTVGRKSFYDKPTELHKYINIKH